MSIAFRLKKHGFKTPFYAINTVIGRAELRGSVPDDVLERILPEGSGLNVHIALHLIEGGGVRIQAKGCVARSDASGEEGGLDEGAIVECEVGDCVLVEFGHFVELNNPVFCLEVVDR